MNGTADDFEKELRGMFERNFRRLRAETSHALAPDVKEAAWQQVLMYWRRLRSLAESITDTEVKLNLPNRRTPKGRPFGIEGVVDIVREADRTTMYDIKTHELEFVRENKDFYAKQLNVYAHIWQTLRKERLDETAVISTPLPEKVKRAFCEGNAEALAEAAREWDPVVRIDFEQGKVEETVREFGNAVDAIEDGCFAPPSPEVLSTAPQKYLTQCAADAGPDRGASEEHIRRRSVTSEQRRAGPRRRKQWVRNFCGAVLRKQKEGKRTFGTRVCGECDARFSCASFRQFAKAPSRRDAAAFLSFFDTLPTETARYSWLDATAETPDATELARDYL